MTEKYEVFVIMALQYKINALYYEHKPETVNRTCTVSMIYRPEQTAMVTDMEGVFEVRTASVSRETKETQITVRLSLDGGNVSVSTGIGFFDHMLTAFAVHGGFGLEVKAAGDLDVDCHHTVEDTGIVLGKALDKALGDKSGIARFGSFYVPMDEALGFCALDISGRPFLVFDAEFPQESIGGYDSCMTEEFMRAFAYNSGVTLHLRSLYGKNSHHITEALYKSLGHALREAVALTGDGRTLSTKGVL